MDMKKDFNTAIVLSSSILGTVYLLSTSLDMLNEIFIYGNDLNNNSRNYLIIINGTIMFVSSVSFVYLMNTITK
jgi:hypothetical protein